MTHRSPRRLLLATILALAGAATMFAQPAIAAAPLAATPTPGYARLMLGKFEVTALSDGTVELPVKALLKAKPGQVDRALAKSYLSNPLETSVNAYLINTGSKLVLVDCGAGALFGPTLGKLVANLKASGYQPEQVDEIYLSHLHPDHVGGLARDGAAVFPNAVVRAERREADYWLSESRMAQAPAASRGFFQGAIASLAPYVATPRFQPFSGDVELSPGVRAVGSNGHTTGHTSFVVESDGHKLVLVGDQIHVGAVQLDDPSVTIAFDMDAPAAAAQRKRSFDAAAGEGALVGASHLPFPGLGHLRVAGKGYQWLPVNYTQMH